MLDEGVAVLYNTISGMLESGKLEENTEYQALIIDCGGGTTLYSSSVPSASTQRNVSTSSPCRISPADTGMWNPSFSARSNRSSCFRSFFMRSYQNTCRRMETPAFPVRDFFFPVIIADPPFHVIEDAESFIHIACIEQIHITGWTGKCRSGCLLIEFRSWMWRYAGQWS